MKNIHVLPTDKPSRLQLFEGINEFEFELCSKDSFFYKGNHIYITSDEEIKEGWYLNTLDNEVRKNNTINHSYHKKIILTTDQDLIKDGVQAIDDEFLEWFVKNPSCEWVEVKEVWQTLPLGFGNRFYCYKIIIPEEEPCSCTDECLGYLTKTCKGLEVPKQEILEEDKKGIDIKEFEKKANEIIDTVGKQETLEEVALRLYPENWESIMEGQHDSNSYERNAFINGYKLAQQQMYSVEDMNQYADYVLMCSAEKTFKLPLQPKEWFEQFKKK